MNKLALTKMQKAYLSGEKLTSRLGGTCTHIYMEVEGKNILPALLKEAWIKVLKTHPVLEAKVHNQEELLFNKSHYNECVPVFDLREMSGAEAEKELMQIRRAVRGRKLRTELGHTCGLFLSLCPEGRCRIHFDLSLAVCDVVSFQILLRDLAGAYTGTLPDRTVNPKTGQRTYSESDRKYWMDRIQEFPTGLTLDLAGRPEKMHGCEYRPLSFILPKVKWKSLMRNASDIGAGPHLAVMGAFSYILHQFSGDGRFLLNVPVFCRDGTEMNYLADDTQLLLLESIHRDEDTFSGFLSRLLGQYKRDRKHLAFDGLEVQNVIKKQRPEAEWPAPVVFSCTPQIQLLSGGFEDTFGKLVYMVSQTPQVWLDAQIHEMEDGLGSFWMIPEGLFSDAYIQTMFQSYADFLERLASDKAAWN